MADYYSILDKTISRLPEDTATNRGLVYEKARLAIARQLRALEPAPSDAAIAKQMESLESAISQIEDERSLDIDLSFDAEMDSVVEAAEAAIQQPEVPQAPVAETQVNEPVSASNTEPVTSPAPQAEVSAPGVSSDVPPVSPTLDHALPGSAPQAEVQQPAPAPQVSEPNFQADLSKKRGLMGRILPYVIGLAIVGGGAYGLWLNKDTLLEMTSGMSQSDTEIVSDVKPEADTPELDTPPEEPVDTEVQPPEKESTRLGGNGEDVNPDPIIIDPVSQPSNGDDDKPLILDPQTNPSLDNGQSGDETPEVPVEVKEVGGNETTPDTTTTADSSAPGIAQKAYLYEEGGANAGASRSDAAIIWTLVQEAPAPGEPAEAVVKGRLDIPDKSLSMNITLKRNTDEGLPASHIIELNFDGGEIDNVARFVMKATEQARGEGLVAVPAKIDNGYFLIALNNLPQAVETNTKLLLESGWIDIPLGYVTGRRALVTLEKGPTGEKVFRDAFEDWKKR